MFCYGGPRVGVRITPNIWNVATRCRWRLLSAGNPRWASPVAHQFHARFPNMTSWAQSVASRSISSIAKPFPLQVPADAEMVIEGWISTDPSTFEAEGPYAEFTGYYAPDRSPKHVAQVTCITHRDKPIFRGCVEGAVPGQLWRKSNHELDPTLGHRLERSRIGRRPRCRRCLWHAHSGLREYSCFDQSDLSRSGQASGRRLVGQLSISRALQTCDSRRCRYRCA